METQSFPLSISQTGIYYEWEKDKSLTHYNMAFLYDFPVTTDVERLQKAFKKVFAAHPGLNARIRIEGSEVVQYFYKDEPVQITLRNVGESEMEDLISGIVRPFDLTGSALYRIEFYKTEKKLYVFVDFHHIIFDGNSFTIFKRDLLRAYDGEELTKESFTVGDYALQECSLAGSAEYLEAEAYFEKRLSGITMTKVPTINNKEQEMGYLQHVSEYIDLRLVNDFCARLNISPNNLFAGALGLCLNRYTREHDIAFCTAHHGRIDERLNNDIGMFVKTLPLTMKVVPDQKVGDYLETIRTDLKELWSRQVYPFSEMVKKFGASMEIMYTFQKGVLPYFEMDGQLVNNEYLRPGKTFDSLNVYLYQYNDNYEIHCEYNDSLYDQEYMKTFASAIKNTVLNIMADQNQLCMEVSILSAEQETKILEISVGETLDHDRALTLVDLFREQVQKTPDNIAVVYEDRKLTYRELDQITDKIAKKLCSLGVQREKVVGVMIDRSEYMVIYPLAIMKAGGAYMPLDYSMPTDRLSFMIKDAGAEHILSEGSCVADCLPGYDGIIINREEISTFNIHDEIILPKPSPEDMYVLLYTSGSTGTPKGCILEHHNIVNFCHWFVKDAVITTADRAVAYANFAFDAHMIDIYPMITTGASVYILPSYMRMDLLRMNQYMEENGLTIAFMTTQIGRQFAEDIENHSLRLLLVGGERLIQTKKPPYSFYNIYGPTECTICSTFYNIESDYNSSVIGSSLGNVANYIMDHNLQLLPVGVAGELCIGGEGVGRGYLNRDDLNKEKFVSWRGQKLYRTGDLARYNEAGEIEYFSRLDNQVKLRGLRIELGEIENAMSTYEGISAAVVDVKEIGGVQHLCGYFTAKNKIDIEILRDHLITNLTEFMVPTVLIQMEKFPLTNNGKVNRKLLPVPQIVTEEIIAPKTLLEQQLFDVISDMLKIKDFGINTNLFTIGMTSIIAIKLSVAIQKKLGLVVQTKDILKLKTIQLIAEHAAQIEKPDTAQTERAYEKRNYYPLTESQMGLYYDWEKDRDALQYNIAASLVFSSKADIKKLKDAITAVVDAHPYLKTTLAIENNEIVQLRRDNLPVEIFTDSIAEEKMESILSAFLRPFNLFCDTLYRFEIYQTESYTYLLFDIHHIVFDGSSMGVLLNDLKEAFEGKFIAPEEFTSFDRALEEQSLVRSEKYSEAEAYFDKLLGNTSMTVFPSSVQEPYTGTAIDAKVFIPTGNIGEFCRQNGITESNFFLAVLSLLVNRYTREDQIAVTNVSSGRSENKLSNLMGMFVKTLPAVISVKNQSVCELAKNIQDQIFTTMENEIFPFTKMSEKYGIVPQINLAYEGGIDRNLYLGDECAQVNFLKLNTVKFPLSVIIFPDEGGYTLTVEFDNKLYHEQEIKRFADTFATTADFMSKNADTVISEISLVAKEQEAEVLSVSTGKNMDHDRTLTLVDLFRKQVQKTPDNIAVVYEDRKLTYRELNQITDKIAKKLCSLGVQREKVVGVMIDRSEYMVIYPLAIMKAGGAYMPLDYSMPSDRLSFMVKDAGVGHILSEGMRVATSLPGFEGKVVIREEIQALETDDEIILPKPSPEDMYVLLYTSGSTGTPKGCILEHHNIVNFCNWFVKDAEITSVDRSVAYANFAFDAHMIDIYPMITTGASVYILPSYMRMDLLRMNQYMEENGLTIAFMTTQIGRQFAEDIENHSLRLLLVGGERLIQTKKPPYSFYNIYGPTECTICSTFYNIESDYNSSVIGSSLGNVANYIMDQNLQLLPVGVAGELFIGGEGVGRGYLNRDDLNKEKFVSWRGQKLYRTGDLARYNEAGEIEYFSRLDNQVKLRGLRIELGEIENAMSTYEGISAAVVDVKEIGGVQHLCGYFTAKHQIDTELLKNHLRASLTEFMVPTVLIQMEKFPLTNNGKVNRKALPMPEVERAMEYIAPTNEVEKSICRIYSDILKIENVGILDSFFEIGGTSITAIKAIIQIINLGYTIKYGDLFKLKTPQAVAKFLSDHSAEEGKDEEEQLEDISGYDYTAINKVLETNEADLWGNDPDYTLGNVLLTGSTGYLGIHVLKELIDKETGKLYCMVRSKGTLTPEQRLKAHLMYYFSDTFDDLFESRIIAVDGDITNTDMLKSLKGKGINTVFNCAASVKHYAAGDELDKINVEGVANLVDLCKSEGARLIHVSTRSTGGLMERDKLEKDTVLIESKLYFGQTINNKYALSKYKAEYLVLQAVSEGLDGKIMRVGNLMGRQSDGEFQINFRSNAFVNVLKSYKVLKMFPLSQLVSPLEISPIDCVAMAIVSLSRAPREIVVLHPYNNYRLNMANVIYAMKEYGFDISLVSDQVFGESFQQAMQDPHMSEYMSGLLHYRIGDSFVEVPDDNDFTTTLLYKNGIRWPLTADDYSIKLIGMLDGMGFFDEK
jgi:gramicidin S synthase 2